MTPVQGIAILVCIALSLGGPDAGAAGKRPSVYVDSLPSWHSTPGTALEGGQRTLYDLGFGRLAELGLQVLEDPVEPIIDRNCERLCHIEAFWAVDPQSDRPPGQVAGGADDDGRPSPGAGLVGGGDNDEDAEPPGRRWHRRDCPRPN